MQQHPTHVAAEARLQRRGKRWTRFDMRNAVASALGTRRNDQLTQTLDPLVQSIAGETHDGTLGGRQHDRMNAELDRFLDDPLELVGRHP